ncbi:MAG: response regulator [Desulfobacterales bacterium]|nr:response regulator [Desulfobacterales bacterium]MBF0396659.1 response regulator [Desulfobacterales bacterium]
MKTLIADDEFFPRMLLKELLSPYGICDTVSDGEEAILAFKLAWEKKQPYDLICLDIMMPKMDGHETVSTIRKLEKEMGINKPSQEVKVIMTTAFSDPHNSVKALYKGGATSYLVKPINQEKILWELKSLKLLK